MSSYLCNAGQSRTKFRQDRLPSRSNVGVEGIHPLERFPPGLIRLPLEEDHREFLFVSGGQTTARTICDSEDDRHELVMVTGTGHTEDQG